MKKLFVTFCVGGLLILVFNSNAWSTLVGIGDSHPLAIACDAILSDPYTVDLPAGTHPNDEGHWKFGALATADAATPVTEPATLLLFGAGLAGLGVFRKKFRKKFEKI